MFFVDYDSVTIDTLITLYALNLHFIIMINNLLIIAALLITLMTIHKLEIY